jgi:hypothetical protein
MQQPDLHFRRNGTIKTSFDVEVRQFGKLTAAATKSKKHVRRRDQQTHGRWNVPATPVSRWTTPDKKSSHSALSLQICGCKTRLTFPSELYQQYSRPERGTSIRQADRCRNQVQHTCETHARPLECPGCSSRQTDNGNCSEFARNSESVDAKPDLHIRRNGTFKIPLQPEVCQFGKCSTATTKSKILVRRSGGEP